MFKNLKSFFFRILLIILENIGAERGSAKEKKNIYFNFSSENQISVKWMLETQLRPTFCF